MHDLHGEYQQLILGGIGWGMSPKADFAFTHSATCLTLRISSTAFTMVAMVVMHATCHLQSTAWIALICPLTGQQLDFEDGSLLY